jgi:hypothetical protein
MAQCKYILRTPGGEKIEIPADYGSLESNEKTIELINTYINSEPSNKESALSELINFIKDETKVSKINRYDIKEILDKTSSAPNVIKSINKYLEGKATYNDFSKALKNYLYKNPEKYDEINNRINRRPLPSDFKNLDTNKVLGLSSLKNEISYLDMSINEARTQGFDYTFLDNIKKFLDAVHLSGFLNKNKNVLISFSTEYGLKSINVDDYSFFKAGNPSSLFLSLFKRVGNSIDVNLVNEILERYKLPLVSTSKEFFDNVADDAVNPSMFEKLLENKENNKIVSEIVKLVTSRLDSTGALYSPTKSVLQNLNPNSYGYNLVLETIAQQQFLEMEKSFSSDYDRDKIISYSENNGIFEDSRAKDDIFSEMIKLDSIDYKYVIQNVTPGKDLLMYPRVDSKGIKHYNPFIIQHIYPKDTGVYIVGLFKKPDGNYEYFKKSFTVDSPDSEIFIRKKENPKIEYNPNVEVTVNDNLVELRKSFRYLSKNDLQNFIKDNAVLGDTTDLGTVVGVYPAYLYIKSNKDTFIKQPYSAVKEFNSSKLAELYNESTNLIENFDYNAYTEINNYDIISKDDIIVDPTSNMKSKALVVYSNPNYVFIIVGNKEKRFIKPISKDSLRENNSKAWLHSYASFTANERKEIIDNINIKSLSSRTLSSFTDINKIERGDYFYGKLNEVTVYGKVLDPYAKKGIIFSDSRKVYDVVDITDISNLQFYTPRNIASSYAMYITRINSWKVEPKPTSIINTESDLVEVRYIVPESVDENNLIMLPSGYANIGRYIDKYTEIPKGYKDITDFIKTTFFKITDKDVKLCTTDLNGSRKYERNLDGLRKISEFNKIPVEQKEKIDPLKKGVYFSTVENGSISDILYRVMDVVGDEVIAQTNKINSNGDLITVEKVFSKEQLYKTPIIEDGREKTLDGSIYSLYLQNGNNKINVLLKATNGILSNEQILNISGMEDLLGKMKEHFSQYGINVEETSDNKEFKNNQYAKIKTDIDENGNLKTSILLNSNKGTRADLVHENLHIFLTALRYSDYATYEKTIESIIGKNEDEDLAKREEQFVKAIVSALQGDYITDFLNTSDNIVAKQLYNVIKKINPNFDLNLERAINNPEELFKSSLKDIFNYKEDISSPYYNVRLIDSEASFRE